MPIRVYRLTRLATVSALAVMHAPSVLDAAVLLRDEFNCVAEGGLITSSDYYVFADFPLGGTSSTNNPSRSWEAGTGRATMHNGWAYLGSPQEIGTHYNVRLNTRRFDFGDVEYSWKFRSGPFGGPDGEVIDPADAVDLWVRYQTQFNLYVVQFARTNNRVVAKRKVPAKNWSGPYLPSNDGAYYELILDSESPTGVGSRSVAWSSVGLSNLAHDTNTVYEFKVKVATLANGRVQIKLSRDGRAVASWTDNSDGVYGPTGETLAQHLAQGDFNSVPGWQAEWGRPITRPGATGVRADNIKIWVDDFQVSSLQTNDAKLSIVRGSGNAVLQWSGRTLQSSDDLKSWNDEACAVSPLSISPTQKKFYRTRN